VPQIEVTFDIDANGIVHVAAKDLGTGKEQSIRITAPSGLNKDEIDKLVKEAEVHAEDDHRKRELVEARNQADTLIYTTQRTLADLGDKVDAATKSDIESRITDLKTVMDGTDMEAIKQRSEDLMKASHKLAEQMYAKTGSGAGPEAGPHGGPGGGGAGPEGKAKKPEEEVVEAEFEEVK